MKYLIGLTLMLSGILAQAQVIEYNILVEGVCGMCKDRIEKTAIKKGKAKSASWDLDTKMLTVEIDESKTSIFWIREKLAEAGHDNGEYLASDEVYDKLHFCCKYREGDAGAEMHPNDHEGATPASADTAEHGHVHEASGYIYGMEDGERIPLIGATIIFEGAADGTTTDLDGYFKLTNEGHHDEIRVSYVGFEDQIIALEDAYVEITLNTGHTMETVEIVYKKKTTEISFINVINTEKITREELCKAACCNLSESFETNPSVDVSYNDAVSGTKQIQMLGLAGPYVQITRELLPDVRTMNNIYGLSVTPGPWIESIQLIKGTGSVVNGFESIAGQINVELKQAHEGERLFVNGYVNNGGRIELNANARHSFSEKASTAVLIHGKRMQEAHDNNGDGFTDMPLENDFVLANRWKFKSDFGLEGQLGIKYSDLNHSGGYHDHFSGASDDHENHWRMSNDTERLDIWTKTGYIWPNNPQRSIGLQLGAVMHEQIAGFGRRDYNISENSYYANLIFQNIFENGHILRTGLSYQMDDIYERVASTEYNRDEKVPGAYAEYTIKKGKKWAIIPGIRIDHHSNYGSFVTPRLHAKYNLSDNSIVRLTAGRGQRTANIFAENISLFASSRAIDIEGLASDLPYGLEAEVATNFGVNYTQGIRINDKEMVFALDLYRTDFQNQIVVDYENPRSVLFYNLDGSSYSNSYQAKIDYELIDNLDIRIAYRLFDVKTQYSEELLSKPFVSKHRAFINLAYKTKSDWHFDTTLNWKGQKRLPNTEANPEPYRRADHSPSYFLANAQISKRWKNKWDVYLGGENLFNYKQTDAIIAGEDAFGEFFDASIVWAPLFGTNIYLGFRYNLVKK